MYTWCKENVHDVQVHHASSCTHHASYIMHPLFRRISEVASTWYFSDVAIKDDQGEGHSGKSKGNSDPVDDVPQFQVVLTWPFSKLQSSYMGMDQYLLIPFLGGWTSIYQLFWCPPGVQGFDTLPYQAVWSCCFDWRNEGYRWTWVRFGWCVH